MTVTHMTATATLQAATIGGAFGAAFGIIQYTWRDRAVLRARWLHWGAERSGELVGPFEPPESSEYRVNPVTEEERQNLPFAIGWFAMIGAGVGLFVETGTDWIALMMAGAASVKEIFASWRKGPIDILDPDQSDRESLQMLGRRILTALGSLAFLGFAVAAVLGPAWLGNLNPGISSEDFLPYFWVTAFLAAFGFWAWRRKEGPPAELEGIALEEWEREGGFALLVAIFIAVIAAIVWLA